MLILRSRFLRAKPNNKRMHGCIRKLAQGSLPRTSLFGPTSSAASQIASLLSSSSKYGTTLTGTRLDPTQERPLQVGDFAELCKTFGEEEVRQFSSLSEDVNPVHLDAAYAANTRFKRKIVHGMLSASLLSAILGTKLPGKGSIYMSQSLHFRAPLFVGEQVRARVEVTAVHDTKPVVTFLTQCFNERDECCIDGEAQVYVPHMRGRALRRKREQQQQHGEHVERETPSS
ncbi:hydroxyacyl-thioester dehydratase htd2 [Balamuthia mandrillaris]